MARKKHQGRNKPQPKGIPPQENGISAKGGLQEETLGFFQKKYFPLVLTGIFFLIVLAGILSHEMWRDEHQAWLVARDAGSLNGLLGNMKYEGNPALWHFLLYLITRVTLNPVFMQGLHLLIATGFIFVFNRYAPVKPLYKILFTFGYFPLYEYAVISRSYGLGILLLFIVCSLFKNRTSHYVLIGLLLALLANVTIYQVVISIAIAGVLFFDYLIYQRKTKKLTLQLLLGGSIFILGVLLSVYQILPEPDNSFPAQYATELFSFSGWANKASRIFSTYFYIPQIQDINFWNTNIYFSEPIYLNGLSFQDWLGENPVYLWTWVYLPVFLLGLCTLIFLRKPLILFFYLVSTFGLLSIFYYTTLLHSRYTGHLLIALVVCYWLAQYYPEKKYSNSVLRKLSDLGKPFSGPFLIAVLSVNIIGSVVAYSTDLSHKFSLSKDLAKYIKRNKLDALPIAGLPDFTASPLSTYLNKLIYYPQMNSFGSFVIWNKQRTDDIGLTDIFPVADSLLQKENRDSVLLVINYLPMINESGKKEIPLERGIVANHLQIDLLKKFEGAIVESENYYLYLIHESDSSNPNLKNYPHIN